MFAWSNFTLYVKSHCIYKFKILTSLNLILYIFLCNSSPGRITRKLSECYPYRTSSDDVHFKYAVRWDSTPERTTSVHTVYTITKFNKRICTSINIKLTFNLLFGFKYEFIMECFICKNRSCSTLKVVLSTVQFTQYNVSFCVVCVIVYVQTFLNQILQLNYIFT